MFLLRDFVAGKYRLTNLIGPWGYGLGLVRGTTRTLGTQVAVKFIDSEYAESPEARKPLRERSARRRPAAQQTRRRSLRSRRHR